MKVAVHSYFVPSSTSCAPAMKSSLLLLFTVLLRACTAEEPVTEDSKEFSVLGSVFDKCSHEPDLSSCLKFKAVKLLDRALSMESLSVSDFISINKDPSVKDVGLPQEVVDLETTLPRDLNQRSSALDNLLVDRVKRYLDTRTIKLNFPIEEFEGRGKGSKLKKIGKKGGGMMLMMFGSMGAMALQFMLGKIALIAGKALVVAKLALLLVGLVGLKSLLNQGHEEKHSAQVIYAEPEHHGGGWSRSAFEPEIAHDLAYRGQRAFRSQQVGHTSLPL